MPLCDKASQETTKKSWPSFPEILKSKSNKDLEEEDQKRERYEREVEEGEKRKPVGVRG